MEAEEYRAELDENFPLGSRGTRTSDLMNVNPVVQTPYRGPHGSLISRTV
jgi:hypothetical protein